MGPKACRHAPELPLPADHAAEQQCDDEPHRQLELRSDVQGFHAGSGPLLGHRWRAGEQSRPRGGRPRMEGSPRQDEAEPDRHEAYQQECRRDVDPAADGQLASDRRPQHAQQEGAARTRKRGVASGLARNVPAPTGAARTQGQLASRAGESNGSWRDRGERRAPRTIAIARPMIDRATPMIVRSSAASVVPRAPLNAPGSTDAATARSRDEMIVPGMAADPARSRAGRAAVRRAGGTPVDQAEQRRVRDYCHARRSHDDDRAREHADQDGVPGPRAGRHDPRAEEGQLRVRRRLRDRNQQWDPADARDPRQGAGHPEGRALRHELRGHGCRMEPETHRWSPASLSRPDRGRARGR